VDVGISTLLGGVVAGVLYANKTVSALKVHLELGREVGVHALGYWDLRRGGNERAGDRSEVVDLVAEVRATDAFAGATGGIVRYLALGARFIAAAFASPRRVLLAGHQRRID
jgi:hypothetical protein